MDIGKVCLRAFQLAGERNMSQQLSADQGAWARDAIGNIIDELQAHGLRARAVEFRNLSLISGTYIYTMGTDVLDVVGDAMYIDPTQTDLTKASGEVPIVMMGRDQWQLLSSKSATGRPVMYYVHRTGDQPQIYLWPIPDSSNAGTIRFQVHLLAADSNDSSKTLDLERVFTRYITWQLAHEICLANSNQQQARYYGEQAMAMLSMCKSFSAQRSAARVVLSHRTGWNR